MFKTLRTVLCAGLAVAASLGVAQAQTKIKYGAYHTANETFIKEITQMMDTITERTDGEVVFEPYYAGSLLKAQDLYPGMRDRKSTRLNSSHVAISYAVFC